MSDIVTCHMSFVCTVNYLLLEALDMYIVVCDTLSHVTCHVSFVCTVNYLLLEALDTYAVVCESVTLSAAAAADIRRRLAAIFLLDSNNERPLHAGLSRCLSPFHYICIVLFPHSLKCQ